MSEDLRIEKATIRDAPQIHQLVSRFAAREDMLPRPLSEIYEHLRDFFVVRENGQVMACVSLTIMWEDLAEIRSLAVDGQWQEQGAGVSLVKVCLEEARSLGIRTVFALTKQPSFFEKLGFYQADVMALPRKVWGECFRCPKFPQCDEVAMIIELDAEPRP